MPDRSQIEVFDLPMNVRFRGVDRREGVVIHGPAGVGEFSPFWGYDDEESSAWLAAAIEAALLEFPTPVRDAVPVNCTVPAVDPERAAAMVTAGHGCRTAKVKVAERGQSLRDDMERVRAVRAALGQGGRIRVDANGAWTVDEAVEAITRLDVFGLEYVEQPCATVAELAEVRRRVSVPIAADESIRRADDPLQVVKQGAADIAVLKVQPLGGVRTCLSLAEQIGIPVVVSSAIESSIGLAAGVALAAALPDLPYACGLGTATMFEEDLVTEPLVARDGVLPVRRPDLDAQRMDAYRADFDTTERWRNRLAACAAVLARVPT